MKSLVVLCTLLVLALASSLWQTWQHGKDSARHDALLEKIDHQGEVIRELRTRAEDNHAVLMQLRTDEQHRYAQGEIRREQIRTATQYDTCANTVVPAAVSERLQYRTAHRQPAAHPASGQSDDAHPGTDTGNAGDLGRDSPSR